MKTQSEVILRVAHRLTEISEYRELRRFPGIVRELREQARILRSLHPRLTSIKIKFSKGDNMAEAPITLRAGQSTIASIDYFDQNGQPMPASFVPPDVTFVIDNPAVASSTPNADKQTDTVTYVSAGTAKLSASVVSAEGVDVSDTQTVTCAPVVVPPPVLTSIKINFSDPK